MATAKRVLKEIGYKHNGLFINVRKGENTRCDKYCPVKDVCPQRKEMLNNK